MKRLALHTAVVFATLAGAYLLWEMREAVVLFVVSLFIAASLRPISGFLAERGLPRSLALASTYLMAIGVPLILALIAAGPIIDQTHKAGEDVAQAYDNVQKNWSEGQSWQRAVKSRLPRPAQLYQAVVGDKTASLLKLLAGATFSVVWAVIDLVLVLFLSVYWSIDRIHFERLWLSLLPVEQRAHTRRVWRSIEEEVGAYLRSEAIQAMIAGCVLWCGYWAIGAPYPALMAAIGGLVWLVPWLGAALAVIALLIFSLPALAVDGGVSLLTVTLPAVSYTLATFLVLEIVVEPRFFNRRRYNGLLTAIVAIGMAQVLGLFGLLLGPPLAAVIQIIGWQWINQPQAAEAAAVAPQPDFDQRLRSIRAAIANANDVRPEVRSLAERLETLVRQTEDLVGAAGQHSGSVLFGSWFPAKRVGAPH